VWGERKCHCVFIGSNLGYTALVPELAGVVHVNLHISWQWHGPNLSVCFLKFNKRHNLSQLVANKEAQQLSTSSHFVFARYRFWRISMLQDRTGQGFPCTCVDVACDSELQRIVCSSYTTACHFLRSQDAGLGLCFCRVSAWNCAPPCRSCARR
jgi:hypothetical protein